MDHVNATTVAASESMDSWIRGLAADVNLGPKASRVLHVLATRPEFASYASTGAVAREAESDATTVVRTARALGFAGWPALRMELRGRHLASLNASEVLTQHSSNTDDPVVRAMRSDLENLSLASQVVDLGTVRAAAHAISIAHRTVVVASGAFAGPAIQLSHVGAFMGLDIRFIQRGGTTLVNTLIGLSNDDCLVAINFWRLLREIQEAVSFAHQRGAATCVLADTHDPALTDKTDHLIVVPSEGASHFPSLTTTMSVTHALLAAITAELGNRAQASMREAETMWSHMGLMYE